LKRGKPPTQTPPINRGQTQPQKGHPAGCENPPLKTRNVTGATKGNSLLHRDHQKAFFHIAKGDTNDQNHSAKRTDQSLHVKGGNTFRRNALAKKNHQFHGQGGNSEGKEGRVEKKKLKERGGETPSNEPRKLPAKSPPTKERKNPKNMKGGILPRPKGKAETGP